MRTLGRRCLPIMIAGVLAGSLVACSGDDDGSGGAAGGDGAAEEALSEESVDVDSCTLVTNEEASALAGTELEATEDSPLGCAYVVPGETVGDFIVNSYSAEGDAASGGAELAPSAEIINLDGVGDDAVALNVDGSVNFLVARQGNLFLVFVTTFLDITPDSEKLQQATDLAKTALGRLVEAA